MVKKTPITLAVITIVAIITGFIIFNVRSDSRNKASVTDNIFVSGTAESGEEENSHSSVVIDFGGNVKYFLDKTDKANAFEALEEAARQNNFAVEAKKYDFGTMVTKIGEKENNKDNAWFFRVNGKTGDVSSDKFLLKPGDKVEWYYERIKN